MYVIFYLDLEEELGLQHTNGNKNCCNSVELKDTCLLQA